MVLYLEFVFWSTWQMREQTWHICQAAHGFAKGRYVRKVAREDDRERARRKKITVGSTLANCQLNYGKLLEMTYF
jgi:hypothetical protein